MELDNFASDELPFFFFSLKGFSLFLGDPFHSLFPVCPGEPNRYAREEARQLEEISSQWFRAL